MPNLQIVINALNKASGDIDKVKNDIKGLGKAGKESEGGIKGLTGSLGGMMSTALTVAGAVAGVAGAIKLVTDAAQEGAAFQRIEDASGSLAASMGADMDDILSALQDASLGMVSDFDLMQAASRAMMLGVSADADELAQLMEVAALRGRAMGVDTTQAFNDIVTGIGRASPLILDNLGIVVDADKNYQAYADSIGKSVDAISKQERTQALLNGVLESSKGLLEETGGLTVDNAGQWEQLKAAQKNYFDAVKADLADATSWWAEYWATAFNEGAKRRDSVNKAQEYSISLYKEEAPAINAVTAEMNNMVGVYDEFGGYVDYTNAALGIQETGMTGVRKTTAELRQEIIAYEAAVDQTAETLIAQSIAAALAGDANSDASEDIQLVADATNNADAAMRSYNESLLFKMASEGLSQEAAYELALAMGLVDERTVSAQRGIDTLKKRFEAGLITEEQYRAGVVALGESLEDLPTDTRINVYVDDEGALLTIGELKEKLRSIERNIGITVSVSQMGHLGGTVGQYGQAVGGAVYGGNPYTWQEYGYRGEMFIPSQNGYVLSRAEAERALSRALVDGQSGGGGDAQSIASAVAGAITGAMSTKQAQPAYAGPSAQDIARAVRDGLLMSRVM